MANVILITIVFSISLLLLRKKIAIEFTLYQSNPRNWLKRTWKEWGEPFLIAAVIAIVIRTFILGPYKIPTGSMRPTLMERDRIFVDKISYRLRQPERGEIIVFKYPEEPKKDFVKRLIAFGGDEVVLKEGTVYVNGKKLQDLANIPIFHYYSRNDWKYGKEDRVILVPKNNFFVLGDNSAHSSDSRYWGFVPEKNLVGRAFIVWWPFGRIGFLS
jgi:signal peptidase I